MSALKNIEVEIKYPLLNSEEIIKRLDSIAEKKSTDESQRDIYYNAPHRDFTSKDPIAEWLRIRESSRGMSANYKEWHFKDGKAMYCDEYETGLQDMGAMSRIFKALDFRELVTVSKVRNTWIYKDVEIVVDEIEGLGTFIELEAGGGFESIGEARERLFLILKEIKAKVGEQDHRGYPYLLMKKKGLI